MPSWRSCFRFLNYFTFGQAAFTCWKRPQPSGNPASTQGWTRTVTMYMYVSASASHHWRFLGPPFLDANYLRPRTPHKREFWPTRPAIITICSLPNLLRLLCRPFFLLLTHFEDKVFPCWLRYATHKQLPWRRHNQYYSHHLALLRMSCLISACCTYGHVNIVWRQIYFLISTCNVSRYRK